MSEKLIVKNLRVKIEENEILKGVSFEVKRGEIHAIMGPNGSGKSTLAYAIMGHPKYQVIEGEVIYKDKNILELSPDERAKLGIFLAFQHPLEIDGVRLSTFLWQSYAKRFENTDKKPNVMEFRKELKNALVSAGMKEEMIDRFLNVGFSGGEKKRTEIVQMSVLKPEIAILDEIDSGLDIDAVKIVSENVNRLVKENNMGVIIITHYQRILNYIKPDYVYVIIDGKIVDKGDYKLAQELESEGYLRYGIEEKEEVKL
ncbi:MAG: Fe-S cluster assembly ATPase SufC [candidate division WOR-3 bacterium]|nr:Fe-S cluster assembly ATPase SufC [candidate division WOR-3 bacterium]MCX7947067.1 Fe-S cluster assembly ATPase SufC [candidate division WOR-3 bacterium]MDW8149892.1 Fe-S cluster assembly ATPase SufC [candidate division WOR-3 bacterium]